jgi:hypothetical protein
MTTLMVTHPVADFDAWKAAFDEGEAVRQRHGAIAVRILLDGAGVVGLIEFPDESAAQSFLADPALSSPIDGVPDRPDVRVLHDLTGRPTE